MKSPRCLHGPSGKDAHVCLCSALKVQRSKRNKLTQCMDGAACTTVLPGTMLQTPLSLDSASLHKLHSTGCDRTENRYDNGRHSADGTSRTELSEGSHRTRDGAALMLAPRCQTTPSHCTACQSAKRTNAQQETAQTEAGQWQPDLGLETDDAHGTGSELQERP